MPIKCKYCEKEYISYSSRSNHVRSKHINIINDKIKNYKFTDVCKHCDKEFYDCSSRIKHEKVCKVKKENDNKLLINKINEMEKKIEVSEKNNEVFKKIIQEKLNIDPATIKIDGNQNNVSNINKQINNTTINNNKNITIIPFIQLGYENLSDVLTDKEKLYILNCRANGLNELIQLVHISDKTKFNKFKSVLIKNLNNLFASTFDKKMNDHITTNKNKLIDDVIELRMGDFQDFYNDLGDKLDDETNNINNKFITRMNTDGDPLKDQKKEEVKLLFYNNRYKIKKIIKNILEDLKI